MNAAGLNGACYSSDKLLYCCCCVPIHQIFLPISALAPERPLRVRAELVHPSADWTASSSVRRVEAPRCDCCRELPPLPPSPTAVARPALPPSPLPWPPCHRPASPPPPAPSTAHAVMSSSPSFRSTPLPERQRPRLVSLGFSRSTLSSPPPLNSAATSSLSSEVRIQYSLCVCALQS